MSHSHPLHSAARPRRREEWHRVEVGVYRGVRDGRAVGEIHTVVGGCVALDATGTPVGRYPTRDEARRALRPAEARAGASTRTGRADSGRIGITTAGVVGGIALVGALTAAAAAPWL